MNHAERLRQLADRMGLDGYAEELREIAGEMEAQPADEMTRFEATMREKHGWEDRDFKHDGFGYFDSHTATAWMAWQARATLKGQQ